jgi:hypothetical protein
VLPGFGSGIARAWAPHHDLVLVEVRKDNLNSGFIVFDPANDSSIDLDPGEWFSWDQDSGEVVVKNGDRFEKRRIP